MRLATKSPLGMHHSIPIKFRFLFAVLLSLILLAGSGPGPVAQAQTDADLWDPPVNLSRSGAADKPVMVIDSTGVFHLIWKDEFAGILYSSGDGSQWSDPVPIVLPSGLAVPDLYADQNGVIHAFWIGEDNTLFYSRVSADRFSTQQAWSRRQTLAATALDYAVTMDTAGNLHLSYIRPLETDANPAGVYYTRLEAGDLGWSDPVALYTSPYFRGLSAENAHIEIDTAEISGAENLYVVWDNRPRETAHLLRSQDGGLTWGEVQEVGAGEDSLTEADRSPFQPSHVAVYAGDQEQLLIWQAGDPEVGCTQYYQKSTDGGAVWQEPQPVFAQVLGCPSSTEVLPGSEGQVFLLNDIQGQAYLQLWDGERWSEPQLQSELTSFVDPETGGLISLSCRQTRLVGGTELFVTGCDQGVGRDIWVLRRSLADADTWFSAQNSWTPPVQVTGGKRLLTPEVLVEKEGLVHVFWSETDQFTPDSPGMDLHYARFEGGRWSEPVEILASARGKAEMPSATLSEDGRLLLVWSGGQSGEIFFSSADSSGALVSAQWARPVRLPSPRPVGSSPEIYSAPDGRIFVVYAIPLNELRGIYLTQSSDGGMTWTDPVRVIDAQAAGWSMVDKPHFVITENGSFHVLWTQYTLPGGLGPQAMYYSRSDDGGASWSNPVTVSDNPVYWSQLVSLNGGSLHRVWQELSDVRTTLWHESSTDNGASWQRTAPVSIFGETVGTPALAWDLQGRLHLLQVIRSGPTSYLSQHWLWNGETWGPEDSLNIQTSGLSDIRQLTADMSRDGELALLFTGVSTADEGLPQDVLYFASRRTDVSPEVSSRTPAPLPQTGATLRSPTRTPAPRSGSDSPQATATLPPGLDNIGDPGERTDAWLGSIFGPLAAGLIIFALVFVGILLRRIRGG